MKQFSPILFTNDTIHQQQIASFSVLSFNKQKTDLYEDKKVIAKSFRISKKMKAPFFIIQDKDDIVVAVRYKRRYKYLSINELSSIVIANNDNVFSEIIYGEMTDDLVKINWDKTKHPAKGCKVDLTEKIIINNDVQTTINVIIETLSGIYNENENPYTLIKKMWTRYGVFRYKTFKRKMGSEISKKLIKRIVKEKKAKIGSKRIVKITDSGQLGAKVELSDGSFFIVKRTQDGVKVHVITNDVPSVPLEKMVVFEKEVENYIADNSEEFVDKHFSWRSFFKYLVFISIIALIFLFVFKIVYQTSSSISLYSLAGNIINNTNRGVWFAVLLWTFFARVIGAWQLKRMLMVQNEHVKMRHVFISNLMSSVISFVTPFAVGGDAIGYWYLRRKGFKRGPLAAAFISDTLLFQARFTLQTLILLWLGWPIYREIFNSNTPEAHGALIMFIVGASWTVFATIMIFGLVLWRQFQEGIIKTAVKLLEWTRFVNVYDPSGLIAKYQYEFKQMRHGMRVVWGRWWLPIELFTYAMSPLFFNPFTLTLFFNGAIHSSVEGVNGYMASIIIGDLVNTANSMSITPGGSGTGEWLSVTTKQFLYTNLGNGNISSKDTASSVDFAEKMLYSWPWLLFSTLSIPTIIVLENTRRKIGKLNKNLVLNNQAAKHKTKLKIYLSILWVAFGILFLIYFFVIFTTI